MDFFERIDDIELNIQRKIAKFKESQETIYNTLWSELRVLTNEKNYFVRISEGKESQKFSSPRKYPTYRRKTHP